jgi:acyl-CoA thioester hydrolase
MPLPTPFTFPVDVRYYEADQQGVVFNMWYLGWFDEAMTAWLGAGGLDYAEMVASGYDTQLVHTELDWTGAVRWGDRALVDVGLAHMGRTSFTIQFAVWVGDSVVVTGSTVYVMVATDGSGKREIPDHIRAGLGPVRPLRPS